MSRSAASIWATPARYCCSLWSNAFCASVSSRLPLRPRRGPSDIHVLRLPAPFARPGTRVLLLQFKKGVLKFFPPLSRSLLPRQPFPGREWPWHRQVPFPILYLLPGIGEFCPPSGSLATRPPTPSRLRALLLRTLSSHRPILPAHHESHRHSVSPNGHLPGLLSAVPLRRSPIHIRRSA